MAESDRAQRVEAHFRHQYEELDNDELAEIAAGDVPWARDGRFVYEARCAARAILLKRGAVDVPHVPAWDPDAPGLPARIRLLCVVGTVALAALLLVGYGLFSSSDAASAAMACQQARERVGKTDFAYHHALHLGECRLAFGAVRPEDDSQIIPIEARGCIELTDKQLERLQQRPQPDILAELQRFALRPEPGRHCSRGHVVFAELRLRDGRPWAVRLRPAEPR